MATAFAGCAIDQDEQYTPHTRGAVFLMQDSALKFSLLHLEGEVAAANWEQLLSVVPATVQDLSGLSGDHFWLADGGGKQILQVSPDAGKVSATWSTGIFTPHYLCEGASEVLVSDTSRQEILLIRKKDGRQITLPLDGSPSKAAYQSGVFFVVVGGNQVKMVHEKALVVSGGTTLAAPVWYLDWDGKFAMSAFYQQGAFFEQKIDYNTRSSTGASRLNEQYRRYSPYLRINYGKEWTSTLVLRQDTLRPWGIGGVSRFFPDFLESTAWIQVGDTLKRVAATGDFFPLKVLLNAQPVKCWNWEKELQP